MNSVLVLGGYGGFGARISRRLAADGHEVLVAGRSIERAEAFCNSLARSVPLALDRTDIGAALSTHRPSIVVDASGPFQAMDYAVPLACIAAGVSYCDIADGRSFVTDIGKLDAPARRAGVTVIAGASSVPALSGAITRSLATGMECVTAVEMAISASNRATAGPAVASAILGQVGRPFRRFVGRRWITAYGWQDIVRQDFVASAVLPVVRRLVANADVPDLALLPERLPGRPAIIFRAGTELAFQNWALWAASWLVRWHLIPGLAVAAPVLKQLQRMTGRLGTDRSAMVVRLFGTAQGKRLERRFTLIADRGDGPEIPALSVPLIVGRILSGAEPPGARDAGQSLSLDDYQPAFGQMVITTETVELAQVEPLYRRIMGEDFDRLPLSLRQLHGLLRASGAQGEAVVTGATNWAGKMIARLMNFPSPGTHPLHVTFEERDGVEHWSRDFSGHRFSSELSEVDGHLQERFGALRFRFALPATATGLSMIVCGWSAFHVPLPLWMAPRSPATESDEDAIFHFDVPISLPVVGPIVHYRGWLRAA